MQVPSPDALTFRPGASSPPLVIAHRGGSLEAPENTIHAIARAGALGVPWVEVDVGLTLDGHAVVLHDDSLLRTTGDGRLLVEATLEDLRPLRAGRPKVADETLAALSAQGVSVPVFVDDPQLELGVPTLLAALQAASSWLMLELKQTAEPELLLARVVADVRATRAQKRVALASFDPAILAAAERLCPELPRIGIASTLKEARLMLQQPLACLAVACDVATAIWSAVPPTVALWCWTVYSVTEAHRMRLVPVDGIITDAPSAVAQALGYDTAAR